MTRFYIAIVVLSLAWLGSCSRECPSNPDAAQKLLARSIAFHDPDDAWTTRPIELQLESASPGREPRRYHMIIDNDHDRFEMHAEREGRMLDYSCVGESCQARVDGAAETTEEDRAALVLDREDGAFWDNVR